MFNFVLRAFEGFFTKVESRGNEVDYIHIYVKT